MGSITDVGEGRLIDLVDKTVLVTGATGSFGTEFIRTVLSRYDGTVVRAFSRDELKQSELRRSVDDSRLRFLLGDVRDLDRLRIATRGVDVIVHAAALKQVLACELNPFEAVQTNVIGTQNVITAAIENEVSLVMGLSTDKAPFSATLYGATKLVGERLLSQAGVYVDPGITRFGAVRYGNVLGSRGSVVPIFRAQAASGVVTITDPRMSRFWMRLDQAVEFVLSSIPLVRDGETFIPKIPSATITDLVDVLAPDAERLITGVGPGEKLHEVLLTEDESRSSYDVGDRYAIVPHRLDPLPVPNGWKSLPDGFRFASDTNDRWLKEDELRALVSA